jgi:anti-sigma factor RsiW
MSLDPTDLDHAEIVGLLQPFVDGELSDDERVLVASRIAENPEYQAIVREQQQVRAVLRSLPRELAPAGLRERVLADLDAVDAERQAAEQRGWFAPMVGHIRAFGRGAMLMVPAAAVAVVLFMVANNAGWVGGAQVEGTHVDGGMTTSLSVRSPKRAQAPSTKPDAKQPDDAGLLKGAELDELGFAVQIAPSGALPPDIALVSDDPSLASSSAVVRYKIGGQVGGGSVMVDNQRRAGVVELVGTRQVFREHEYHLGHDDQGRPRVQFQIGRVHHSLVLEGGDARHGAVVSVDAPEFQSLLFVADALRQAHGG